MKNLIYDDVTRCQGGYMLSKESPCMDCARRLQMAIDAVNKNAMYPMMAVEPINGKCVYKIMVSR